MALRRGFLMARLLVVGEKNRGCLIPLTVVFPNAGGTPQPF